MNCCLNATDRSDSAYPLNLTNVNGTLFFTTNRAGAALYRTDGTAAGTEKLVDVVGTIARPDATPAPVPAEAVG